MLYVFGYGSLISPKSASVGLDRRVVLNDLQTATLKDFKRCWNAVERIQFDGHEAPSNGIFLNLRAAFGSEVNGVLLALKKAELEQMKLRERNYDCIDVTGQIIEQPAGNVYTFITPPERSATPNLHRAWVPVSYFNLIRNALKLYDAQFAEAFENSTDPLEFGVLEDEYRFVDARQEKYARGNG
jgi:hypothetical protein